MKEGHPAHVCIKISLYKESKSIDEMSRGDDKGQSLSEEEGTTSAKGSSWRRD